MWMEIRPQGPVPIGAMMSPGGFHSFEHRPDPRVVDRLIAFVRDQILLADIGDVARIRILGEEVVEGLLLGRPHRFGDRLIPFLAIGELRIDIENDQHAAAAGRSQAAPARHRQGQTVTRLGAKDKLAGGPAYVAGLFQEGCR